LFKIMNSFIEFQEPSLFIKIILNYLSILQTVTSLGLSLPSVISGLFSITNTPITNSGNTLDCILNSVGNNTPYIYLRIVFLQALMVLNLIVILLMTAGFTYVTKSLFKQRIFVSAAIIFFFTSQPQAFAMILQTVRKT